ncbi:MAG: hypothetical protein KDC54_00165 [Lewinella sp.]|nr:hypothetical protein [Lewinella sp.]
MTQLQVIIEEINHLSQEELAVLLREVIKRIDQQEQVEGILNDYVGIGEGLWDTDAQAYIDDLRQEDEKEQQEP